MEKSLYIVMPAYNEAENIKQTIDTWYPIVEKHSANGRSRFVIINDGSKDDTFRIMQEYAQTRPLFQPLTKPIGDNNPKAIVTSYDFQGMSEFLAAYAYTPVYSTGSYQIYMQSQEN